MESPATAGVTGGIGVGLRYLAVVVLVGAGLALLWNAVAIGRTVLEGSVGGVALGALNLAFSVAAIALAVLVAAPARRSVGLAAKILAVPCLLGSVLSVLSGAALLMALAVQQQGAAQLGLTSDSLVAGRLIAQGALQDIFFSVCTLALAILVLVPRRRNA